MRTVLDTARNEKGAEAGLEDAEPRKKNFSLIFDNFRQFSFLIVVIDFREREGHWYLKNCIGDLK